MKKPQTYSIEEDIIRKVEESADKHEYMNRSNIVEQAIKLWLKTQDNDWVDGFKIGDGI